MDKHQKCKVGNIAILIVCGHCGKVRKFNQWIELTDEEIEFLLTHSKGWETHFMACPDCCGKEK